MLLVEGLRSRYGRIEALHGIDLHIDPGEIVSLVGTNGAGKTTFLRTLSGVQPHSGGTITFGGKRIEKLAAHKRVGMGMVQVPEGRQIFPPLTVEENLLVGGWTRPGNNAVSLERVYQTFPVLKDYRNRMAGLLSGGQQQMLAIGRALMAEPKLLLLDEPSMGLAPMMIEQIFEIISVIGQEGVTVLVVEQNLQAALSISTRGYVLETGKLVLEGSGAALLNDPRVREFYLGSHVEA